MSKANQIRELAEKGMAVADIARQLGIRYQHAYHVLRRSGFIAGYEATTKSFRVNNDAEENIKKPLARIAKDALPLRAAKANLSIDVLLKAGFCYGADWQLIDGQLELSAVLPKAQGVYAMVQNDVAMYVGVATMGLAKRIRLYARPGKTQRTSARLNNLIKQSLMEAQMTSVYYAMPQDSEWNDLPIHASAGLELGLIKKFKLPWNIRGI